MNIVIYARYSSHSQTEQSIEGQLQTCYEFAKNNGHIVIGEYIDRAQSGTTDSRAEFQRMIADSDKHTFDAVLVYQLDRFARNRYDSAINKAKLKKNGVRVISARENISDDASGILVEGVLESMAEYYSAELSQKIQRGMDINAEKCLSNGSNPGLGYYVDEERRFHIDPEGAAVVREIFEMYASGKTVAEITKYLNAKQVKTSLGKEFNKNSLHRLLRNKRYIGYYIYKATETPDGMPRIIEDELFERVQHILDRNKKAPARSRGKEEYLLTTKLFCGECESLMVGECGTSRSGAVHHYYKCTNAKRHGGCRKKAIKKDWIENLVVLEIRKKLEDARFIDDIVHAFMEFQTAENTVIPHLKQSLAELNKSIDNILAAIEQGIFTQSTKQRLEELESKKKDIEIEIAKESIRRPLLNEDQVRFWFERLRNLNINELSHRKRLIDTFLNSVFVYDNKLLINCNYPNTSTIVRFSDINATLNGSDILACGRPKISRK